MSELDNLETFNSIMDNLWIIILCFGVFINLTLVCVIWSRKPLHRSLFFFMVCFAINDCVQNVCLILLWKESVQTTHSCTLTYLLNSISWNFKPILISTVFVMFSTRPDVSKRNSLIIIAVILFVSVLFALPEGFDAKLNTDIYGYHTECSSSLSDHPIIEFMSLLVILVIPVILLIGYSIIKCTTKCFLQTVVNSETQQMLLKMLIIYSICWTPYFIFSNFVEKMDFTNVNEFFQILAVVFYHVSYTLMAISTTYKPFLLYFMNQNFKVAVSQIIRSEPDSFVMFENLKTDNCTN